MSESLWTTETPTKPGLYFYSAGDGSAVRQYRAWRPCDSNSLRCDFLAQSPSQGGSLTLLHSESSKLPTTGYWQPVTIPDPYVAPKPPELKPDEVWEARMKVDGAHRWVFRIGDAYFPRDSHGSRCNGDRPHKKSEIDSLYTLIRRVS